MKSNSLIIFESLDEAGYFVNKLCVKDGSLRNSMILSLNPNVRAYLQKNGFTSLNTSEMMDSRSYNEIMDKCREMEGTLRENLKKNRIEIPEDYFVHNYFHYLRQIWRHFLFNIELISKLLLKSNCRTIYAFKYNKICSGSPWVDRAQFYFGDLAEMLCQSKGIDFIGLRAPKVKVKNEFSKLASSSLYIKICNRISFLIISLCDRLIRKNRTLLIPSPAYNMDKVCDELSRKERDLKICLYYIGSNGIREILHALIHLYCAVFKQKIGRQAKDFKADYALPIMTYARFYEKQYDGAAVKRYSEEILSGIRAMGAAAVYKNVDLMELLYEKVKTDLIPDMLKLHFEAFGLEKAIQAIKLNYVISQMNFGINGALGEITRKYDIPSVLISHGSHVPHEEKNAAWEHEILAKNILVGDYRYSAVQSPHAREIASKIMGDGSRIIPIKPTLWGKLKIKPAATTNDHLTLVHAGTLKLRHNRRFIYETSDEYLQSLTELIEIIDGLKHLKMIIKIRTEFAELSLEAAVQILPKSNNVNIESRRSFGEVLSEAQLLVSFSSTTIEEALNNNVPVLLYGGQGRYAHISCEPYAGNLADIYQAVTFVKSKDDLKSYLTQLNDNYRTFKVSADKFKKHCFAEDEVADLEGWFSKLKQVEKVKK